MLYMTPTAWAEKYFTEGCRPSETTLRRWMNDAVIPARKIGGNWYIDEHIWLAGGDELVQRVLQAG